MAQESVRMDSQPGDTAKHLSVIGCKAVLDSRKVKEWGLNPKVLPFDVQLINQPVSFYQQYTYQIWSACALFVILVLGLCISLFYYFRTKRLRDELLKSEKDLRVAKDRAEESNRLKSAFLANMSHEIRTPLNAIVGFSNLIAMAEEPDEIGEYVKIIETNNELLLQLVNDILDLSKIEAGQMDFNYSAVDLSEIFNNLQQVYKSRVKDGVDLVCHLPSVACVIHSEKNRLTQVLSNFLSNACKYTSEGSITMGYERIGAILRFYVADTGKGLAEENIPHVFERFAKFDSFVQGTGLGLSICESIIQSLDGKIGVDSELGKGSTFWFTIPYNPVNE